MITNKTKEEVCMAYKGYLQLIYWFGKGVMLAVHIQQYFELIEGKNKTTVWRDMRVLQSKQIIDIHKLHGNNYIKLKKYALKFLLEKESTKDIKSINYGFTAIKKSAFNNEFILQYKLKGYTIDELINYYSNNTTFINKNNQNTAILKRFEIEYDTVKDEVINLDALTKQQLHNLKTKTAGTKIDKLNSFNLNNMQSRSIYISSIKENIINVVFFDISDNYTSYKMAEVFEKVYTYLSSLFDISKKYNFIVVVSDLENGKRVRNQKEELNERLQEKHIFGCFTNEIKNLNIRAKAFNNVKILL